VDIAAAATKDAKALEEEDVYMWTIQFAMLYVESYDVVYICRSTRESIETCDSDWTLGDLDRDGVNC